MGKLTHTKTASSVSSTVSFEKILAAAKTKFSHFADLAEDIANETWIIAQQRGYFYAAMLKEAARNLSIHQTVYTSDYTVFLPPASSLKSKKITNQSVTHTKATDERLAVIMQNVKDKRVIKTIKDILQGHKICDACKQNALNYKRFITMCRKALTQPNLF